MEIIEWWPRLDSDARAWLMAHNGEAVSPGVLSQILAAGGELSSRPDGFYLSDEEVDWIEAAANDETD